MKHYICLFRESAIAQGTYITYHFQKDHPDANSTPETAGLFSEFKKDNLDWSRVFDYLTEYKWKELQSVKEQGTVGDSQTIFKPAWTIEEFVLDKHGALTGIIFDIEGRYLWHQRYFLDITKPT